MNKTWLGVLILFFVNLLVPEFALSKIHEMLVSGIRTDNVQFQHAPKPKSSKYLMTNQAGFYLSEFGARYYCGWDFKGERKKVLYVRIQLSNPADRKKPIVQEGVIDTAGNTLNVAFGPIKDLRMHGIYQVEVWLYEDKEMKKPIDHMIQNVKSYADTRNDQITIDPDLRLDSGENVRDMIMALNPKQP